MAFQLATTDTTFNSYFHKLAAYKKAHGHCRIPAKTKNNSRLKGWIKQQRILYRNNLLPQKHIQQLETIGFVWSSKDEIWNIHFQEVVYYKKTHGNCNVPPNYSMISYKWLREQRLLYKKNLLPIEKVHLLEKIGALVTRQNSLWQEQYQALIKFKNEHGHCRVPRNYLISPKLGPWVNSQRYLYHKGRLQLERIKRLGEIEFPWERNQQDSWELHSKALMHFIKDYNHSDVPKDYTHDPQLKDWISAQRIAYHQRRLAAKKVKYLNAIGFEWRSKVKDRAWESAYQQLQQFKELHGHCKVPFKYELNPILGHWVYNQRLLYHRKKLSNARTQRLEMLGFEWRRKSYSTFERLLKRLQHFKKHHGHCNVPVPYPTDPSLGYWVSGLKQAYRKRTLSSVKIKQLEKLGIRWKINLNWESHFQKLESFKNQNGHCNIPYNYPADRALGWWIAKQRYKYKKNQLSKDKIAKLESLGFFQ